MGPLLQRGVPIPIFDTYRTKGVYHIRLPRNTELQLTPSMLGSQTRMRKTPRVIPILTAVVAFVGILLMLGITSLLRSIRSMPTLVAL